MLLHTHQVLDETTGEDIEVYVIHTNRAETSSLSEVLSSALIENPDSDTYLITLGKVEAKPESELVVNHDSGTEEADG